MSKTDKDILSLIGYIFGEKTYLSSVCLIFDNKCDIQNSKPKTNFCLHIKYQSGRYLFCYSISNTNLVDIMGHVWWICKA